MALGVSYFFLLIFLFLLASKQSHNALCMTNLHSVCECVACLFAFYCYVDSLKMSQLFHNYFFFIFPSPLVHRWTAFCSMLSPHSTTCCCIRKGQKWQCAQREDCRRWWHCCPTLMSSSWPSLLTACRSWHMAIRKARYWSSD